MDNITIILTYLITILLVGLVLGAINYNKLVGRYALIEKSIHKTYLREVSLFDQPNNPSTFEKLQLIIKSIDKTASKVDKRDHEYHSLVEWNRNLVKLIQGRTTNKTDKTNDFSIERIVLLIKLIDSSEQEKNRFCKTKFDNNLCSLDGIFYLNYFCKNGKLFKWKVDIQYWDLFNVDCIKKDEIPKDINGKDILISTNIADIN